MRQLCPNCSRLIELPESAAGSEASCPECGRTFRVPGTYTPTVDPTVGPAVAPAPPDPAVPPAPTRPVPPPGFVPPAPPSPVAPDPASAATPSGYENSAAMPLAPNVIAWVPAACLTLAFLLTFFAWVGSYPGGHSIYSQSPWGALFAKFTVNTFDETLLQDEPEIKKNIRSSWLLLFYLPLLILAVVAAWLERVFGTAAKGPPDAVKGVWGLRYAILAGLAVGLFLILLMQVWAGFGLEVAIQKTVEGKFTEAKIQANDTKKTSEIHRVEVQTGQELAKHALQSTTAFSLVILLHVVAVLALLAAWWLDRRGAKPPPRVVLNW